jgi:multidrug resistance efflux pump
MSALSDLVKYAQMGDVRYIRGDHNERFDRTNQAGVELAALHADLAQLRAENERLTVDARAIQLLVAGGFVSDEKLEEARALAQSLAWGEKQAAQPE